MTNARELAAAIHQLETTGELLYRHALEFDAAFKSGAMTLLDQLNSPSDRPLRALAAERGTVAHATFKPAMLAIGGAIEDERRQLRATLFTVPAPSSTTTGHLRPFTAAGEPVPPVASDYVPTPVVLPRNIKPNAILQHPKDGDCYFVGGIRVFLAALQAHDPARLASLVTPDPHDPAFVVVNVAAGTYRVRATLPIDPETGAARFVGSDDGSTLAPYLAKAAAAHFGSWNDLVEGNSTHVVLTWLAGPSAARNETFLPLLDDDAVLNLLKHRTCVIEIPPVDAPLGPNPSDLDRLKLRSAHVYTSNGVRRRGRIALSDPLGLGDPPELTLADLKHLTPSISWLDTDALG